MGVRRLAATMVPSTTQTLVDPALLQEQTRSVDLKVFNMAATRGLLILESCVEQGPSPLLLVVSSTARPVREVDCCWACHLGCWMCKRCSWSLRQDVTLHPVDK